MGTYSSVESATIPFFSKILLVVLSGTLFRMGSYKILHAAYLFFNMILLYLNPNLLEVLLLQYFQNFQEKSDLLLHWMESRKNLYRRYALSEITRAREVRSPGRLWRPICSNWRLWFQLFRFNTFFLTLKLQHLVAIMWYLAKKLSNKNEVSHQMALWWVIMLYFPIRCKYLIFMNGSLISVFKKILKIGGGG